MSKSAYTPGPWCAIIPLDASADPQVLTDDGFDPLDSYELDEQARANAHLIAAAPELYEALEDARKALWAIEDSAVDSGFDQLGDLIATLLTKANAALAKARGEQA